MKVIPLTIGAWNVRTLMDSSGSDRPQRRTALVSRELYRYKKGNRKVQGMPHSQTAALPRPQEEEETHKSKQAQTEQTY